MSYAEKIVLHSRSGYKPELDSLVEDFIRDGVKVVATVGIDCELVSDIIAELVVADGSDAARFILRSWHPDKSLDEAVEFARFFASEYGNEVQIVEL